MDKQQWDYTPKLSSALWNRLKQIQVLQEIFEIFSRNAKQSNPITIAVIIDLWQLLYYVSLLEFSRI